MWINSADDPARVAMFEYPKIHQSFLDTLLHFYAHPTPFQPSPGLPSSPSSPPPPPPPSLSLSHLNVFVPWQPLHLHTTTPSVPSLESWPERALSPSLPSLSSAKNASVLRVKLKTRAWLLCESRQTRAHTMRTSSQLPDKHGFLDNLSSTSTSRHLRIPTGVDFWQFDLERRSTWIVGSSFAWPKVSGDCGHPTDRVGSYLSTWIELARGSLADQISPVSNRGQCSAS